MKLIESVNEFIIKANEDIVVMDFMESLMLVPASTATHMYNFMNTNGNLPDHEIPTLLQLPEASQTKDLDEDEEFSGLLVEIKPKHKLRRLVSDSSKIFSLDEEGNVKAEKPRKRERVSASHLEVKNIKLETRKRKTVNYSSMVRKEEQHDEPSRKRSIKRQIATSKRSSYLSRVNEVISSRDEQWLSDQISLSKVNSKLYKCVSCQKKLSGYAAIQYHIASKKCYSPRHAKKIWVSDKIKEGKQILYSPSSTHQRPLIAGIIWNCVQCQKVANSEQSLRYHLSLHANDIFDAASKKAELGGDEQ